jgi:hypothetical protein
MKVNNVNPASSVNKMWIGCTFLKMPSDECRSSGIVSRDKAMNPLKIRIQ